MYEIYAYCPYMYPCYRDAHDRGCSYSNFTEDPDALLFMEEDIRATLSGRIITVVVLKDGEFLDTAFLT